jgi:hypothetical protein
VDHGHDHGGLFVGGETMKRLEHGDIVESCKTAIQQLADEVGSFSKDDVIHRVLAVHPSLDRARVDGAAAKCLQAMEPWPTREQDEADYQETVRHVEAMIASGHPDAGFAYLEKKAAEALRMANARAFEIYAMRIDANVLGRHGDRCMNDLVKRIGEDAFIDAVKDELRRDGQLDSATIKVPTCDDKETLTCTTEQFLHWFRVEARRILNDEKPRIVFHFRTGPEEAA